MIRNHDMDIERDAFEEWAVKECGYSMKDVTESRKDDAYTDGRLQDLWWAWWARGSMESN